MEHHDTPWTRLFNEATGLHVPDGVVMSTVVAALLVSLAVLGTRRLSVDRPGTLQQVLELVIGGIGGLMANFIPKWRKHFAFIATFALFVFTSNFFGMIPTLSSPSTMYAVTLSLAVISFTYYNQAAIREVGVIAHLKHFCGPLLVLAPLMFPIELISHLARVLSLSLRLFGNMNGEHEASLAFYGLAGDFGFLIPVPLMALGLLGVCLQTFIFVQLSILYISMSTEHH